MEQRPRTSVKLRIPLGDGSYVVVKHRVNTKHFGPNYTIDLNAPIPVQVAVVDGFIAYAAYAIPSHGWMVIYEQREAKGEIWKPA